MADVILQVDHTQQRPVAQEKNDRFDPATHRVPRYDIYGNLKPYVNKGANDNHNALAKESRVPEWWGSQQYKEGEKRTQTKMLDERRKDFIPDPTFDLDGDGVVGGKDYVLAKIFDKDKDGRLNTAEKNNAIEALRNGFEHNFVWNVEQAGSKRPYRLLQKRGVVVDAEEFLPVWDTYPAHPNSNVEPKYKTHQEKITSMKAENKEKFEQAKRKFDEANPATVPKQYIQSEFLVQSPKHNTLTQIKEIEKREARAKCGLTETGQDLKDSIKAPSLSYVESPEISTKVTLENARKTQNLYDLKKLESHQIVSSADRLNERELAYIRLGQPDEERITYKQRLEQRKKDMIDYNMKTFGNVAIGIHGKELPKYAEEESLKEWWKIRDNYNTDPKNISQYKLRQTHNYWAKGDPIRESDVNELPPPPDPFKTTYAPRQYKNEIPEKINAVNPFKKFDSEEEVRHGDQTRALHTYKWTTQVQHFSGAKKRIFEILPQAHPTKRDLEPLYSSFCPNNIFQAPATAKDMQNRKDKLDKTDGMSKMKARETNANPLAMNEQDPLNKRINQRNTKTGFSFRESKSQGIRTRAF